MQITHGLISADSHVQLARDAFTSRMSSARFGDRIPHVRETTNPEHMPWPSERPVERWFVNRRVVDTRGVSNSPAVMNDPLRTYSPQRWEEMPRAVYDPLARLEVLDRDGVDGEVLFPNPPVQSGMFFQGDPELELACVKAYNDAVFEWREASERYIPLAMIPYHSGIAETVAEVERVAQKGFRGIQVAAEPSAANKIANFTRILSANPDLKPLEHFCTPYWEPLWAACQAHDLPIHWHTPGAIALPVPRWQGFSAGQQITALSPPSMSTLIQFLPSLIFSGVLQRYPRLQWVLAETAIGWLNYTLEACDHEWQRHRLWRDGLPDRPSEALRGRLYATFWFERHGIESRDRIGVERLMWESDFPHNASTYPDSWRSVERTMAGIPEAERKLMLYGNALRLYKCL